MSPRARRASTAQHHVEWLQLVDVSGPFLSLGVLAEVFPHGLDAVEPELAERLKQAYAEWQANRDERRPDAAIDAAFVDFVLRDVLEYPDELVAMGAEIGDAYTAALPEHRVTLRPERAVRRPGEPPKLLVTTYAPDVALTKPLDERGLHASPAERMRILLSRTGVRSGLVTNGGEWILVHVPAERTATFVTWYTNLLVEERVTLRALRSFLGVRRLFGVDDPETLDGLFERSRDDEREVTDQLGCQARHAVELLVAAFDKADRESGGSVTEGIRQLERNEEAPSTLYESVVALAMRIIFLLAAEARGLFPDDGPWAESYAVTPLRAELEAQADRHGIEVLERRFDAWPRLLATFRAVHGGVEHGRVRMPGYGGGLFDPKRYPFLADAGGAVPRISNRTVLHVLDALQTLDVEVPGGRERRPLSFRALGIEQIGHVYEGLLDHTALRADAPALGLIGTKKKEPEIAIFRLEEERARGEDAFAAYLKEQTGRSPSALKKALAAEQPPDRIARLRVSCGHDAALVERALPFLGLVRDDVFGDPAVFREGDVFVTLSPYRRSTGTHYTPPSLTEPIVQYALEPVVYRGPAEGVEREQWELKRPSELLELKVCDIAMGSAAFLVAACRYLAARLVEAWALHPDEAPADAGADREERELTARRLVAERCLYGVDVNPLAVEIAKVSLWLTTLRRDRPFTFLDHALRCGDSLLGLTTVEQLEALTLKPEDAGSILLEPAREAIRSTLGEVSEMRARIGAADAVDLRETEQKATALAGAERKLHVLRIIGDLVVGAALEEAAGRGTARVTVEAAAETIREALATERDDSRAALLALVEARAGDALMAGRAPLAPEPPQPFQWVLEFPEVFHLEEGGFDSVIGNPPFLGGQKITGSLGDAYREFLISVLGHGRRGTADLCAFFLIRAVSVLRSNGVAGELATNTIGQGDTREVGLQSLLEGGNTIIRANRSVPWPAQANLEVAHVWITRREWHGEINGEATPVDGIDDHLMAISRIKGSASRLRENGGVGFVGSYVLGKGFLLEEDEALEWIAHDGRLAEVLFRYVNGEDVTTRTDQSASRWAINFRDWPSERAQTYGLAWNRILDAVKPERERRKPGGEFAVLPERRKKYWIYAARADSLYVAIDGLSRVLVNPKTSKYCFFVFLPSGWVYTQDLNVFSSESDEFAGVLSSTLHQVWVERHSGTLETRQRYNLSDAFETFPRPLDDLRLVGTGFSQYAEARSKVCADFGVGITKVYNRVHEEPEDTSEPIDDIRRLRRELDRAVADAYGWTDLKLDHDFRETPLGLRYTISDAVKTEVLDRLLELNHARYAEEVAQGLHAKGAKRGKKARRKKDAATSETLFES